MTSTICILKGKLWELVVLKLFVENNASRTKKNIKVLFDRSFEIAKVLKYNKIVKIVSHL